MNTARLRFSRENPNCAQMQKAQEGISVTEIEREYTFLVNELPRDLGDFPSIIIEDNFIPKESGHPILRIRRKGERYEITKKHPVDVAEDGRSGDSSRQVEHTTPLSKAEYEVLNKCDGKRFKKRRVFYEAGGIKSDIDVYLDKLAGLVTADFEFENDEEMAKFEWPSFVGADVSQEKLIAGGMLAGKSYADIGGILQEEYGYEPVKGWERYDE